MDYLWNADHLSRSKFSFEHLAYCSATFDWLLRYMMVHSIFVIKLREGRGIILVEPLNEIFYHLTRAHEPLLSIAIRFETLSGTIRLNCTTRNQILRHIPSAALDADHHPRRRVPRHGAWVEAGPEHDGDTGNEGFVGYGWRRTTSKWR